MDAQSRLDSKGAAAQSDRDKVSSLIADLSSKNRPARDKAHDSLLAMGEWALSTLVAALSRPSERVRWEAGRIIDEIDVDWSRHADEATVSALVTDLGSQDGMVRVMARRFLVAIGRKAVDALEKALKSPEAWRRWEAAKALGQIRDPAAIEALIRALDDDMFDVRWLAAEGLIAIGQKALVPLLRELAQRPDSLNIREAVHRYLHAVETEELREAIKPVLRALEDVEAPLAVPFAAREALRPLIESGGAPK